MYDALFHPYEQPTPPASRRNSKVSVIGTGQVGMAVAYAMVIQNTASQIMLVDANEDKAEGEAMDIQHGLSFVQPMNVSHGTLEDCAGSDIIVITAGVKRRVGEDRLELVGRNIELFKTLIPQLVKVAPDAIYLIVSNPVDVMTYATLKLSGLPPSSVIGSGTILDTSRFRALLSQKLNLAPHNVHAYVLGEHGDSEVPIWSGVYVASTPLRKHFPDLGEPGSEWEALFDNVRNAAQHVIKRKGATCYAIGLGVNRLIQGILQNEQHIFTVSAWIDDLYGLKDVCLSLPSVIGRCGVNRLVQLSLDESELEKLQYSGRVLRNVIEKLDLPA